MALSPHSSIPPPRSGAASVVVKGRLYMFGGYGGGTYDSFLIHVFHCDGTLTTSYNFIFDCLQ